MNPKILFENNSSGEHPTSLENSKEDSSKEGSPFERIFSYPIERLIKKYVSYLTIKPTGEFTPIHVDEIASKIAFVYEKIRKIIDWKEDNLLRRNAIERILKRKLISEISKLDFIFKVDIDQIGEPLVLELIRGGHLPNDKIPQEKVVEVQRIINKYFNILKNAPFSTSGSNFVFKKRINFSDWIIEIAACEIEEILSPPVKENTLIETMTAIMNERIRIIPAEALSEEEKIEQTYIAVHQTLFDLDDGITTYHLLKYKYPNWTNPPQEFLKQITKDIFKIWKEIEDELSHPLSKEFFNICEKTDTAFTLLSDTLDSLKNQPEKISQIIADRSQFKELITNFYNKRLQTLKSRLFKLAIFSTLSVFVANWFTFFIIEIPLAKLFYEGFNFFTAAVDFIVPSLAMFILVAIIRPPAKSNQEKVIDLVFNFVYESGGKDMFEIKLKKKKRPLTIFIVSLFYLIACFLSFGVVAGVFYKAGLPITSVVFDTLTIAINVFAALIIRNKAKEITVEEKTTFWEFLLDILFLPVAQVGSWLGNKWREYNVVAVFFNVVIEMPFVTLIEFVEDWRNFLKEKKAEIH